MTSHRGATDLFRGQQAAPEVDHSPPVDLFELLCCPQDGERLYRDAEGLACEACSTRFPITDGLVSFLSAQPLTEQDHRERAMRDEESGWYDPMFEGYTNAVEVPAAVRRLGRPAAPSSTPAAGPGASPRRSSRSDDRSSPPTTAKHACGG